MHSHIPPQALYYTQAAAFYLCVSKFVLVVVNIEGGQQLLCSFPAVHKLIIWDGMWIQDAIAACMKSAFQD